MVLAPLATTDDLQVRLGRVLTSTEEEQADALLLGASARVRTYTGLDFTAVTDDIAQVKVRNGVARLPKRPVTAVSTVVDLDNNNVTFTWLNDDRVRLGPPFEGPHSDFAFEPWHNRTPEVRITYDHGYDTIPADVIDVVCQIVSRAIGRPPDAGAIQQESISGYSYSVGGAAAAGSVGMMTDEKAALDVYRRVLSVIHTGP